MKKNTESKARLANLDAGIASLVDNVILGLALVLVPISAVVLYYANKDGWSLQVKLEISAFVCIWLVVLSRGFLPATLRATAIACLLTIAMLGEISYYGLLGAVPPLLVTMPILAALIGGLRIGLAGVGVIVIALIGIAWITITTEKLPPIDVPDAFWNVEEWALRIFVFSIAGGIGVWLSSSLNRLHRSAIAELWAQNDELEKSQRRISHSAELAGLGYSVSAINTGQILDCDEAFAKMHGMTVDAYTALDIRKDIIGDLIHEDDRERALGYRQRMLNGERLTSELRYRMPDGQYRALRKVFTPREPFDPDTCVVEVICQDVSETRQVQEQLFQSQKMEAIGQLTGGWCQTNSNQSQFATEYMNLCGT